MLASKRTENSGIINADEINFLCIFYVFIKALILPKVLPNLIKKLQKGT